MSSTFGTNSLQPSLIIDIGCDNVKFTQPILNTFSISQLLRNEDNFIDNEKQSEEAKNNSYQPPEEEEKTNFINPNTIFDISEFCHSFPTLLGNFSKESFPSSQFFRKNRTNEFKGNISKILKDSVSLPSSLSNNPSSRINPIYDFYSEKYNAKKNLKFPSDIIYNGEIQDFTGWRNIIERLGEFGYNRHRFEDEVFSQTPLILTQSAVDTDILFSQNEKILEILFEEYKCPQLLICSQALINLLSFNQTSGTVVDLGESGTQITTVIDGYTQYNDSVYNSFLSGRNLNLLYYYEKKMQTNFGAKKNENMNTNNPNNEDNSYRDLFSVGYLDYFSAKSEREKLANLAFYQNYFKDIKNEELRKNNLKEILDGYENYNAHNTANIHSNKNFYGPNKPVKNQNNNEESNLEERIKQFSEAEFRCHDSFYFYPKFFRNLLSLSNNPFVFYELEKHNESSMSIENEDAVKIEKKEYLLEALNMLHDSNPELYPNLRALLHQSVGDLFPNLEIDKNVDIFKNEPPPKPQIVRMKEKLESIRVDLTEEELFIKPSSFLNTHKASEVKKFQMSINTLVITNMENLIFKNIQNAEYYRNVYFCGGILNSSNFTSRLQQNYNYLISGENKNEIRYNFSSSNINDNIYSFYKGANFLSKLESLDSIMISRLDYYEKGKEKLCFNFI